MYACVCYAVSDDGVRDHVRAGACSAKDVRAACGIRPGCGACVNHIRALIEQHGIESRDGEADAAA